MLRRLHSHLNLILLALLLVIVPGVLVIAGQSQWGRQRLQELIARQLAQSVHREVSVGPIRGNLLQRAVIEGIAVAEGAKLADGAVVAAERVELNWDPLSVLRGRLAPLPSIRSIHVWNARLHVVRDERGRLNLQQLLPPSKVSPLSQRFRGKLYLHNATALYEDSASYVKLKPLRVKVAAVNMVADAGRITRLVTDTTAQVTDGHARSFTGRVIIDSTDGFVDVSGRVADIDAAWFMSTFGLEHSFTVTGGRADVEGAVYRVPRSGAKPVIDFSGSGLLRGIRVVSPSLPAPLILDGTAWGSRQGFHLRRMTSTFAGTRYALTGTLALGRVPTVDLQLASDHALLAPLVRLAPQALGPVSLTAAGPLSVRLSALGPASNPDLRLAAGVNAPLSLRLRDFGTVHAQALQVAADVVAPRGHQPSVRASLAGSALTAPLIRGAVVADGWPRRIEIAPLRPFRAVMQWCGGAPVAQADLQVPLIRADNLALRDLRTRLTLVNDTLRLQRLQVGALGGQIVAEAALRLSGHGSARVRGTARGLDLARLSELPLDLGHSLAGKADLTFQGQATAKQVAVSATVAARDLTSGDYSAASGNATVAAEYAGSWRGAGTAALHGLAAPQATAHSAEALFQLQDHTLTLENALLASDQGTAWARGDLDLRDRTLELQVRGAEVNVASLAPRLGLADLSGLAYASGALTGTFTAPNFQGRVTVFAPGFKDYGLDAFLADIRLQGDSLAATDFMASRGSGIVSGSGTLNHLGQPPEQQSLQATLQAEGVRVAEVVKMAGEDWPVDGLAEVSAAVSGSLAHPQARGVLRLSNAHYDDLPIAYAQAPFALDRTRLTVSELEARVLDAPVRGRVNFDLTQPMQMDGNLRVGEVRLQGVAPFWDPGVDLGGTVTLPNLWVRGPLDNLQGGAQVIAEEVNLGGETIRDVDANISLARDSVQLQETTFEVAGGRVVLRAGYHYASDPPTVSAEVTLLGTGVPDLLFLAVPVAQALDRRPAAEQEALRTNLRSYALRLGGTLEGSVRLSGPAASPTATVDVEGRKLLLDGRTFPDLTAKAALTKQGLGDMALALRQGDSLITVDGDMLFDGPINANIEGSGLDLAQLRQWLPQSKSLGIPFGGRLGFTVVASGQTRRPDLTASVDIVNPSFAGVGFDVLSVPVATVREGEIAIDTLVIKREQQQIILDGRLPFSWSLPAPGGGTQERQPGLIPDGAIALNGRIDETDLAFFLPLIDEYLRSSKRAPTAASQNPFRWATIEAKGRVNSSVTLTGTVKEPTLRGFLRVADGSLQPAKWGHPLEKLQAQLSLTGTGGENLVAIENLSGAYDQTQAEVAGRFYLDSLSPAEFWHNRFDLTLKGAAADQGLPGGLHLSDLGGGFSLRTQQGQQILTADNFGFRLGEAKATLSGKAGLSNMTVQGLASNNYDLTLNVTPGRIAYANLVNAVIGGQLRLVTPEGASRALLKGDWQVAEGMIGVPPSSPAGASYGASSSLPSPELDVRVAIGRNLAFRGSGMSAPLDSNPQAVRVVGTPQQPRISGAFMARGGQISLPTSTLRLSYLGVNYTVEPVPGSREDPVELRVRGSVQGLAAATIARTANNSIRINVSISGALPDQVVVQATSNPPLTETQIYALLGGIPFAQLPGIGGQDANLSSLVSEQFLAMIANAFRLRVFQPIEEEIKRALGLSELGITFAFDQPVSLQVGKYVLRNLLVSYERPLTNDSDRFDLRVSYELPGGLRISYHQDERNDERVEIGYGFSF